MNVQVGPRGTIEQGQSGCTSLRLEGSSGPALAVGIVWSKRLEVGWVRQVLELVNQCSGAATYAEFNCRLLSVIE